jgi:hypothetical protein
VSGAPLQNSNMTGIAGQPIQSVTRLVRQSSSQAPRKLRDSCTGCASSKLKCTKEKPTCSRCSRRGLACVYVASRRTGRASHSANRGVAASVAGSTRHKGTSPRRPQKFRETYWSPPSQATVLTPRSITHPPSPHCAAPGPAWCALLSPGPSIGETSLSPLVPIGTDLDDLLASSILENSDGETLPQQQTNSNAAPHPDSFGGLLASEQDQISSRDFSAVDVSGLESIFDSSNIERPQQPPNSGELPSLDSFGGLLPSANDRFLSQDLSAGDFSSFDFASSAPRRCCLTLALQFLAQLCHNTSTLCTQYGSRAGTCELPTIEFVVSDNKQIIESISNMLDCSCSQDEYVIAIISLVVFKVMAWYAAAAHDKSLVNDGMDWGDKFHTHLDHPCSTSSVERVLHLPTVIGHYCVDGNDQSRMAAQLVLSELHRVQQLVNLLSNRFQGITIRNCDSSSFSGSDSNSVSDTSDGSTYTRRSSPLSGSTFFQLEADLRKRLRAVSSEVIDILRGE